MMFTLFLGVKRNLLLYFDVLKPTTKLIRKEKHFFVMPVSLQLTHQAAKYLPRSLTLAASSRHLSGIHIAYWHGSIACHR